MNTIEEIKNLKSLLDQGAINEEEFQNLKKGILTSGVVKKPSVNRKPKESPNSNSFEKIVVGDTEKHKNSGHPPQNYAKPFFSKSFKNTGIVLLIALVLYIIGSPSSAWKKKQFNDYDDLVKAFTSVKYDNIKKEFGDPYYKFLDLITQQITYRWHGVGVKGHEDSYLNFDAMEYATAFFKGYEFKTVQGYEGYYAPSNDNFYNIE